LDRWWNPSRGLPRPTGSRAGLRMEDPESAPSSPLATNPGNPTSPRKTSEIPGFPVRCASQCAWAAFYKESRMKLAGSMGILPGPRGFCHKQPVQLQMPVRLICASCSGGREHPRR
jgi:hypothetical protein